MASSCKFIIVLLTVFTVTTKGASGQAEVCGGMIEGNSGTIQLRPRTRSCFWVITLENTTGIRLEINPSIVTPILVIPQQNVYDENLKSFRLNGSKDVFYNYEGKALAIMAPYRTEESNLSWTGLAADISGVSLSTKFVNESNGTLEWTHDHDGMDQVFWAFDHSTDGQISWSLETLLPACYSLDPCESIYFAVLEITANATISEILKICDGSSKLPTRKATKGSELLVILHINAPVQATTRLQVTWEYDEHYKENVQGLIAGTSTIGPVVIPFNSTQETTRCQVTLEYDEDYNGNVEGLIAGSYYFGPVVIPFNSTQAPMCIFEAVTGLAFDWNTSRIYWLQYNKIMRANLNGSETETLLVSDVASRLEGLAIDPVSGNLYFGNRSSKTIRVCNKNANKCSTIASGDDLSKVYDLAVHWSKGFLFWSVFLETVVRTNLDGSNQKILSKIRGVQGIAVDEEKDRLYWGFRYGIVSSDLDGGDIIQLPNVNTDIADVAIHGKNLYYAPWYESRINVISKLGTNCKLVANLTKAAEYIAVYGKRITSLPQNPCEKSNCAHLCVLITSSSYRCLCPDGEKLASDSTTCTA